MKNAYRAMYMLTLAVLAGAPALASAQNFSCKGRVHYVASDAEGQVYVDVGYGVWQICGIDTPLNSVSVKACQQWYSTLLSANLSGKQPSLYFNPLHLVNEGKTSCQALATWRTWQPYFLSVAD